MIAQRRRLRRTAAFAALALTACATTTRACQCTALSPAAGFDRAQVVFSGTIVEGEHHLWRVAVDRVWKGRDTLAPTVWLMDAFAATPCESTFKLGQRYLIYAARGKGVYGPHQEAFFHPRTCSWTSALGARRVVDEDSGRSMWIEDLVVQRHGAGTVPDARSSPGP